MDNRVVVGVIAFLLLCVVLIGGGYLISPNSVGISGFYRNLVLQTTHLAYGCNKQVEIGEHLFVDESVSLQERAAQSREWFSMALSCQSPLAHYHLGYFYLTGLGVAPDARRGMAYLKEARLSGYSDAAALLAREYYRGESVPADLESAVSYYEDCARDTQNTTHAGCAGALASIYALEASPPNFEMAYSYASRAAEAGNPRGLGVAAHLLYEGKGTGRDVEKAREWAEQAAAAGEANAYETLARIYLRGEGVPVDVDKGMENLQRLDSVDEPWSNRQLGIIYRDGLGQLAPDLDKSVQYFRRAADGGDRLATREVSRHYYERAGRDNDASEAFRWLNQAADDGDATAMLYLSRLYFNGLPSLKLAPSKDKGWDYLNRANKRGEIGAKADLAYQFYTGDVVSRSHDEAYQYALAGAEGGDAHSQAWLGFFLREGVGVEENQEQAIHWLEKSAEQGHGWGMYQLAETCFHGAGGQVDRDRAYRLFEQSFQKAHPESAAYLGYYYEHGLGESQIMDPARAYAYYMYAAQHGSSRGEEEKRRMAQTISPKYVDRAEKILLEMQSSAAF